MNIAVVPTNLSKRDESRFGTASVVNMTGESTGVSTLLKELQPQKEEPSKDVGNVLLLEICQVTIHCTLKEMRCKN